MLAKANQVFCPYVKPYLTGQQLHLCTNLNHVKRGDHFFVSARKDFGTVTFKGLSDRQKLSASDHTQYIKAASGWANDPTRKFRCATANKVDGVAVLLFSPDEPAAGQGFQTNATLNVHHVCANAVICRVLLAHFPPAPSVRPCPYPLQPASCMLAYLPLPCPLLVPKPTMALTRPEQGRLVHPSPPFLAPGRVGGKRDTHRARLLGRAFCLRCRLCCRLWCWSWWM